MKNKNTLVILTPGFAKDEDDTTCIPLQQTLIRAINRGYPDQRVIILAFQYPYVNKQYSWFGNKVISFNGRNKGGIQRLLLRQRIFQALNELNQACGISGLLSFWYGECAVVGDRFSAKHGLKHFCWILGQDAKKENKYPQRNQLLQQDLLALSDFLQLEMEKNHGLRPTRQLLPGIDTRDFNTIPTKKDIDIVGVGSLVPLKRFDILLRIVAQLKTSHPSLKVVLVGDGPERTKLRSIISDLDIVTNVILAGEMSHIDTLKTMQRSKILLHPSSYEGFGVVMIEGLYAGCQVISFAKPMQNDISNWHTVNTENDMTAKAMELLSSTTTSQPVLFASIEKTAQQVMQLYE